MRDIGLVLLAAGNSRRMGSPKQLLDVGGEPMLRRAASAALRAPCRPVVVVCGANAAAVRPVIADLPLAIVENASWQCGVGTSIREGLRTIAEKSIDAVIIALADQPHVNASVFYRLIECYRRTELPIVASDYSHTLGAPALFDRVFFPRLLELPDDRGCKEIILGAPAESVARCSCPEAATDVDTPEDYGKLLLLP